MNIVQGAGVEAVLPKVPASTVHPVDVLRIPEIRATDGLRQRLLPCGHADKMNVIRHQAVAKQRDAVALRAFAESFEIETPVVVEQEDILAIVARLCNNFSVECSGLIDWGQRLFPRWM